MPLVKIHYSVEGDTTVIATLSANISKLDFIRMGLPGQPEGIGLVGAYTNCAHYVKFTGFKVLRVEKTDGSEISDWESKPPHTLYVVGIIETTT